MFTLSNPGDLIAALPSVLGFKPEESFVVVTVEDGYFGCAMRIDLTDADDQNIGRIAELAAANAATAVIVVIVSEGVDTCAMCKIEHKELAATVRSMMARANIDVLGIHVTAGVDSGTWHTADGEWVEGTVPDPQASVLAATAVADGRKLYGSRDEMAEEIAVTEPVSMALLVGNAIAEPTGSHIDRALALLGRDDLSDGEVALVANLLHNKQVRDVFFALANTPKATEAEQLWLTTARRTEGVDRAVALGMFAFFTYRRGDGGMTGVALDAALGIEPGQVLCKLLDAALRKGLRPEVIGKMAEVGTRAATEFGVKLPA